MSIHEKLSEAPDLRGLIVALADNPVEWVLAGSVAVLAWLPPPWPFMPGDIDVVPERSATNLERLARALETLTARPIHDPAWPASLSPEECERWTPWPAAEERLNHRFETPLGQLDIVPRRAGLYEKLRPRSHALDAWGVRVWVADPEDLAATMRPGRTKHARRLALMGEIRGRSARGEAPCGLTRGA